MYYRDEDKNRTGDLDYFAGFLNKLTHQDPDDLEFYDPPTAYVRREFTMEEKLAYDEKERRIQRTLDGWQKRWGKQ